MNPRTRARAAVALAAAAALSACDLDLTNPNAPAEGEVVSNLDGIVTLGVGLQSQYADNLLIWVRAPALVSDEWGTRPLALAADQSLVSGEVDPTFGVVSDPFAAAYRLARTSNILIESVPGVEMGPGLRQGSLALARLLKAMALGNLALQYQQAPVNADPAAPPAPRAVVLDSVLSLLEAARADLASVNDAELAPFRTRVLGSGFDLRSTIDAMLARYYLIDGQYAQALAASQRVSPTVLSVLQYPNPGINPIHNYAVVSRYTGTRRSFFTEAEPGDARPAYWGNRAAGVAGSPDSTFEIRQYAGRNDPYPLYLPDEMRLIRAEVYARQGSFELARAEINAVRTQTSSPVNEPVAALPPLPAEAVDTEAEALAAILYERRYELHLQGLRWEDLRRLRAVTPKRPSIEFLPYPQNECDRNPAQPCG